MAQTAVDRMDEYLGMKDGPERNFSQTLQDRRDESIGATESSLVDRLFKSVQEAFSPGSAPGRTMSDRDRALIGRTLSDRDLSGRTLSDQDLSGRTLSDADLAIGRTISDQDLAISQSQLIRDEIEQGKYGLSEGRTFSDNDWWGVLQGADPAALLSEKGATISDRDRAIIRELTGVRVPPIEVDRETTEVITESPAGAAALDETLTFPMGPPDMSDMDQTLGGYKDSPGALSEPELPSAMELAQMGYGMGSGYAGTPKLREGLGTMIDEAQAAAEPLSKYEQMLLLASLGIPAAALGGRAVGGLMSKLGGPKLGRPIPPRSGPAAQRILGGVPSAMRDMGPQAGNITAAAHALNPIRSLPGITGRKGLESLKQFMGKESLRRPQVSKMAGAKFVDPDHKKVFTRAFGGPKDNTMYMWSDDAADYFKDTMSRKTFKIPRKGSLADDLHDYPQW